MHHCDSRRFNYRFSSCITLKAVNYYLNQSQFRLFYKSCEQLLKMTPEMNEQQLSAAELSGKDMGKHHHLLPLNIILPNIADVKWIIDCIGY